MDRDAYLRGFEDALDIVLFTLYKCNDISEARSKIEELYADFKESKCLHVKKALGLG